MTKLPAAYPGARELVTEGLDKPLWWDTLKVIVQFLHSKNVDEVRVEFGAVLNRDPKTLKATSKAESQTVRLSDLESVIKTGLDEGTIEWGKISDFLFHPLSTEMGFMSGSRVYLASPRSPAQNDCLAGVNHCGDNWYRVARRI